MYCVTSAKKSNAEDLEVKLRFSPLASPYWLGREIGGSCPSLLDKSPNRLWSSARREPGGRESGGCTRPAATILWRHAADTNGYPRRSFARIPSGISRSVRRSDFGNFERSMQPNARNGQTFRATKGLSCSLHYIGFHSFVCAWPGCRGGCRQGDTATSKTERRCSPATIRRHWYVLVKASTSRCARLHT